jgi:hypothetical protein
MPLSPSQIIRNRPCSSTKFPQDCPRYFNQLSKSNSEINPSDQQIFLTNSSDQQLFKTIIEM